eukprot:CAMPEP_0194338426 /NCGR_PEP_ID=MMETSP0171-20130528/79535_1 /TAXON_ID=218684 /ORGANISM="Corethron pennatum, Strain L29A3" /LENGTH=74 /DNA_ID=CAMNT_0039102551 /DNA_START=26 /DNA_END=247 /DNA_ORIENTATION=-
MTFYDLVSMKSKLQNQICPLHAELKNMNEENKYYNKRLKGEKEEASENNRKLKGQFSDLFEDMNIEGRLFFNRH